MGQATGVNTRGFADGDFEGVGDGFFVGLLVGAIEGMFALRSIVFKLLKLMLPSPVTGSQPFADLNPEVQHVGY